MFLLFSNSFFFLFEEISPIPPPFYTHSRRYVFVYTLDYYVFPEPFIDPLVVILVGVHSYIFPPTYEPPISLV